MLTQHPLQAFSYPCQHSEIAKARENYGSEEWTTKLWEIFGETQSWGWVAVGLCIFLLGAIACGQLLLEVLEGAEVSWKLLRSAITSFPTAVKQLLPASALWTAQYQWDCFMQQNSPTEDLMKLVWADALLSGVHFSTSLPLQHLPRPTVAPYYRIRKLPPPQHDYF